MGKPPRISEAEWSVASVLWAAGPLTALEVMQQLPPGHGWAQKTVNTFLTRLVDKGVLAVERVGKANRYRPRVSREVCVREESRSFMDRVFGGMAAPTVAHFLEHADLSPREVSDLQALLARRRRKAGDR
jgi:BlaI family penicillinase repressor